MNEKINGFTSFAHLNYDQIQEEVFDALMQKLKDGEDPCYLKYERMAKNYDIHGFFVHEDLETCVLATITHWATISLCTLIHCIIELELYVSNRFAYIIGQWRIVVPFWLRKRLVEHTRKIQSGQLSHYRDLEETDGEVIASDFIDSMDDESSRIKFDREKYKRAISKPISAESFKFFLWCIHHESIYYEEIGLDDIILSNPEELLVVLADHMLELLNSSNPYSILNGRVAIDLLLSFFYNSIGWLYRDLYSFQKLDERVHRYIVELTLKGMKSALVEIRNSAIFAYSHICNAPINLLRTLEDSEKSQYVLNTIREELERHAAAND